MGKRRNTKRTKTHAVNTAANDQPTVYGPPPIKKRKVDHKKNQLPVITDSFPTAESPLIDRDSDSTTSHESARERRDGIDDGANDSETQNLRNSNGVDDEEMDSDGGLSKMDGVSMLQQFVISTLKNTPKRQMLISDLWLEMTLCLEGSIEE